jgi:C4-dicarboxylate transporter, DctM subunit
MVVYAAATEVSVGRMFMAGVIPGIVMGVMLMIAIYIAARIKGLPAQKFAGWRKLSLSAAAASGGLFLIVIIMGGIYGGIFTPTEAAAVSAVYALGIAMFGYRDMGPLKGVPWRKSGERLGASIARNAAHTVTGLLKVPISKDLNTVLVDAAKVSIMLMFIIANAFLFAHVLTSERIPQLIAEVIIGWGLPPWGFLIVVNILLLIAGNFMEPSAILLIMAPILFPIAVQLGIDPIHLGIIMVVNMEIGLITPPVGLNLFVASGITGMSLAQVVKAAFPWLGILLVFLIIITYVPAISTFLPNLFFGPEIVNLKR